MLTIRRPWTLLVLLAVLAGPARAADLLNVSYDPTRELWKDLNEKFAASYAKQGQPVTINMSHGGSGSQARAVIDGLDADVVSLAMWPDTDAIRKAGLIDPGWEKKFPNDSVPYTSTAVFVVRKGNPKKIHDWPDLVQPGVQIVTPNPKTSGNGKVSFLSAWGSVTERGGSEADALKFVSALYANVPVLDLGARGSTVTFVQKKIGDVHLTWENEAYLEVKEAGGEVEIVYPPISFLAEPPVAVVDANAKKKGTEAVAKAYLDYLYTDDGQRIIAEHFYRPIKAGLSPPGAPAFPPIRLFKITAIAKDWNDAYDKFFGDGKIFDGLYKPKS
jgi:sulfate transport system substrate-binding protein